LLLELILSVDKLQYLLITLDIAVEHFASAVPELDGRYLESIFVGE
jgi:hypothetical protein